MAAPNIAAATTITPNSLSITPADTSRTEIVSAPSTGMAYKINQIVVANIDGTNAINSTVELRLADGSTYRALGSTISVPANATLVMLDKTTSLYLLDTSVTGQPSTLWVTSGAANKLTFTVSYEAIS